MNYFLVAIVASIAVTCTLGAPFNSIGLFETVGSYEPVESIEFFDDLVPFQSEDSTNLTITLKCLKSAIQRVAEENNLGNLWEQTRQRLRGVLERLQACKEISDPEAIAGCVSREWNNGVSILRDFFRTLYAEDRLDILRKIHQEVIRQCRSPQTTYESGDFSIIPDEYVNIPDVFDDDDLIEKLKCAIHVIDEAVKESGGKIEVIWKQTKTELDAIQQNLRRCKELPSHEDVRKCIAEQLKAGGATIARFLRAVAEEGYGNLLKKIKDEIQEKCGGENYVIY